MSYRLYKKEKLCSVTAINALFSRGAANYTCGSFPIRAFWRYNPGRQGHAPVQFLISVPKKRLRHAVDRVTMRRRIREAYRLLHGQMPVAEGVKVDVAFVYVDSRLHDYARVSKSMRRILESIAALGREHAAQAADVPAADAPAADTPAAGDPAAGTPSTPAQ